MHFTTSCFVVKVSCACHFLAQHTWLFQELKTSDNEIRLITTLVIIKIFNIKKSTKPSNEQKKITKPKQNNRRFVLSCKRINLQDRCTYNI